MFYNEQIEALKGKPSIDIIHSLQKKFPDDESARQRIFPLEQLYYCEKCWELLSVFDATVEIISFFCIQCHESMPPPEAATFGYRCPKCFDCPGCSNSLSIIPRKVGSSLSESPSPASPEASPNINSVYTFRCLYCKWNSITDLQLSASSVKELIKIATSKEYPETSSDFANIYSAYVKSKLREQPSDVVANHPRILGKTENQSWSLEALEQIRKQKASSLNSRNLWDSYTPWHLDEFSDLLSSNSCYPVRSLYDLKKSSFNVDFFVGKNLDQILADNHIQNLKLLSQANSLPMSSLKDERFPQRKSLAATKSRRCPMCNKYVIRKAIVPLSPIRISNTAVNFLPFIEVTNVTVKGSSHLSDVPCINSASQGSFDLLLFNPKDEVMNVTLSSTIPDDYRAQKPKYDKNNMALELEPFSKEVVLPKASREIIPVEPGIPVQVKFRTKFLRNTTEARCLIHIQGKYQDTYNFSYVAIVTAGLYKLF